MLLKRPNQLSVGRKVKHVNLQVYSFFLPYPTSHGHPSQLFYWWYLEEGRWEYLNNMKQLLLLLQPSSSDRDTLVRKCQLLLLQPWVWGGPKQRLFSQIVVLIACFREFIFLCLLFTGEYFIINPIYVGFVLNKIHICSLWEEDAMESLQALASL